VNGDNKEFLEACGEVVVDLEAKTLADSFEFLIGEIPEGKVTTTNILSVDQLKSKGTEIREFFHFIETQGHS